jgi:hypothetical protein
MPAHSDSLYLVIESLQSRKHRNTRFFIIVGSGHSLFWRLRKTFIITAPIRLCLVSSFRNPSYLVLPVFILLLSLVSYYLALIENNANSSLTDTALFFFFSTSFHCYKLFYRCSLDYLLVMSLFRLRLKSMYDRCVAMTLQDFVWNHFLVFRRAANIPVAKTAR